MNLLFDYGGVLVDLDKQRCIRAFEALGFDIRPYLGTYAQAGFFSELERGAISVEGFCSQKWRHATESGSLSCKKTTADITHRRLGGEVSKREIYKTNLPHRAIAVYLYLESRANKGRTCYPAIGTIARELHLSVSTVKRAITDLEREGFLRKKQRWRENGGRSSLLYEIIR